MKGEPLAVEKDEPRRTALGPLLYDDINHLPITAPRHLLKLLVSTSTPLCQRDVSITLSAMQSSSPTTRV